MANGFLEHGVVFVKYASLLLQAISIQIDEDFLFAVLEMSKLKGLSWDDEDAEEYALFHSTSIWFDSHDDTLVSPLLIFPPT
jgi:hypothetical protein